MAKQAATRRNKPEKKPPAPKALSAVDKTPGAAVLSTVDMTFGFPGKLPINIRHAQFIQAYVKYGEIQAAANDSGYSLAWAKSHAPLVLRDYHDYVAWLQAHKAQQLVRSTGIEQSVVVEEMSKIAFANDYDFMVFELEERTIRRRKQTVRTARRKHVHELTRDQLAAVEVYETPAGLKWKFRDRDQKLQEIGKHLGLFNEKIILEHRHRHLHAHMDLSKIDMTKLEALEAEWEAVLGITDAQK